MSQPTGAQKASAFDVEKGNEPIYDDEVAEEGGIGMRRNRWADGSKYLKDQAKMIRMGFIRKVYMILSAQLLLTAAITIMFVTVTPIKDFVQNTPAVFYAAWVMTLVVLIALVCCDEVRRQYPMNYIMLGLFTVCEAYLLGAVSSFFDTTGLLMALSATAIVTLSLTAFALQTKFDFTTCSGLLFVIIVLLFMYGFANIALPGYLAEMSYALVGSLLFSAFIVYDTQLIVGGSHHKYQLTEDEYIFAALNLYVDIVNLFIFILLLFAGRGDGGGAE